MRKLAIHMTPQEIKLLKSKTRARRFYFSPHSIKRMRKRNIHRGEVIDAIVRGRIVEYLYLPDWDSHRVLLKGSQKVKGDKVVKVVVDVQTGEIVTTYVSLPGDRYSKAELSKFNPKLDIQKSMDGIYKIRRR